ncbi:MAG: hypothetical protein H3C31_04585 [Brumimicrobium sp.]|nr:hypothetical protein [Brumimicrobium sp.]
MKFIAHFYKLNHDFSPEFAEAHHEGRESENNRRYDWEDELNIKGDFKDIRIEKNTTYTLQGEKDGKQFSEAIPRMILFHFIDNQEQTTTLACSESLVNDYTIDKNENGITLNVILDELETLTNPVAGVYINILDFPKFLI